MSYRPGRPKEPESCGDDGGAVRVTPKRPWQ
jgi:hypothetical protein